MLEGELMDTVLHACRALMGIAVGANEIIGFTNASGKLAALVTEFEKDGWAQAQLVAVGQISKE